MPLLQGARIRPSQHSLAIWDSPFVAADFQFVAGVDQAGEAINGAVSFNHDAQLIADVPVSVRVTPSEASTSRESLEPRQTVQPYRRIFASYSHKDRPVVEHFEHWARGVGDSYLIDCQTLRAGEVWQPRLTELISEADVFQLFWSANASQSAYVEQEWRHALGLAGARQSFIRPVYWEDEAAGLIPSELRHIHFQRLAPHWLSGGAPLSQ